MTGRMSAREIVPGVLWQRGQFLTWTAEQKRAMLVARGVDTVVNLWSKVDPDLSAMGEGFMYLCWLITPHAVPEGADEVVEMLRHRIHLGHRVLVHCEAGRGRSVWLCARLVAALSDVSRAAALAAVEEVFPGHSLRPELLEDLR